MAGLKHRTTKASKPTYIPFAPFSESIAVIMAYGDLPVASVARDVVRQSRGMVKGRWHHSARQPRVTLLALLMERVRRVDLYTDFRAV